MGEWMLLLAAGAGTFALRASAVVLFGRVTMPDVVVRALRHVGPAAVGALIAVAVARPSGAVGVAPRVLALAVAAVVAVRTKSLPATLVTGFALLWVLA